MAASSNSVKRDFVVLVEIRPLLRAANVFVQNALFETAKTMVQIERHRIELIFEAPDSDRRRIYLHLKHASLVPGSCSGFTCVRNAIQFRVRLDCDDNLTSATEKQIYGNQLEAGVSYRGVCSFCGTDILNRNTEFRRVLPLPSAGALEMSDGWFCHRHTNDEDDFDVRSCLQPKDSDCLTGEDYILLNSRDVNLSQLTVDQSTVFCRRCLKEIGSVMSSNKHTMPCFQFHSHSVVFASETAIAETGLPNLVFISNDKALMKKAFVSLLRSNQQNMSCRMCFKTKLQESPAILLWLMDGEITVMIADSTCNTSNDLGPPRQALKLLYCIVPQDSPLQQQWASDVNVTVITVIHELHSFVMNTLVDSTAKLPVVCRKMDMYWVAYLLNDRTDETDSQKLD